MARKPKAPTPTKAPAPTKSSTPSNSPGGERVKVSTSDAANLERHDMPTVWVDRMVLNVRTDPDLAILRFFTLYMQLDGRPVNVESSRIMVTMDHLRKMVNVMARVTNHYPTPEA